MVSPWNNTFAHGKYGDDSGVNFYGSRVSDNWEDCFPVSDRFIAPIFLAILDRAKFTELATPLSLAVEWNQLTGWTDAMEPVEIGLADVTELIGALTAVSETDVAPHAEAYAAMPKQIVDCALVIADFLRDRTECGLRVFIERD